MKRRTSIRTISGRARVYLQTDQALELAGGGARGFGRALDRQPDIALEASASRIDWVSDLGARIGSRDWWRGL
ncbi:hypothetical protein AB2C49_33880, partial [Pseudomonas aeruginosa]